MATGGKVMQLNINCMLQRIIVTLALVLGLAARSHAVGVLDPGLVTLIQTYEGQAKKALRAQDAAMTAMTTGHIWTREEVDATTQLQRQYNEYLDMFNGLLVYAAQGYGFYHEIGRLTENFGDLTRQLKASPANALAVALTPKRNKLYRDLILMSVDIVNDIRLTCLSDIKMTEKERMEIVFGIRPKLKSMNRKLRHLARAVKYTSLNDVWLEIDSRARQPVNKNRIADAAFRRWRNSGRVNIDGSGSGGPTVKPPIKPGLPGLPDLGTDNPWSKPPQWSVDSITAGRPIVKPLTQ